MVLVLVGILSLAAFSRLSSSRAFAEAVARDELIAVARSAQRLALGRDDVSFTIESSPSEWVASAKVGGGAQETLSISSNGILLETGSPAANAATCASAFDTPVAGDFQVNFDSYGNVENFINNAVTEAVGPAFNGIRICVNDTDSLSVCISPAGFASAGNCDE